MQKNIQTLIQAWRRTRQQKQHRLDQGRLMANEAATRLPDSGEMPLAKLHVSYGTMPPVYTTADKRGHLLIVSPADRPWREQLTLTLTHWPGAALVVDPDGRLYQQTAAARQNLYGLDIRFPATGWGPRTCCGSGGSKKPANCTTFSCMRESRYPNPMKLWWVIQPSLCFVRWACLPRPASAIPSSCSWTWP